ncbi:phage portal protein [Rhizobium sp. AC44/96]|uniref:phage portal protein n=1 Tax=Rhizobium sp. AC44/96 TaxID=1841654 RepID=UPI00080F87A3|nr:phage portal protein [Rhizobium sp. AC44/96]OCJ05246.1 phage portal protein [Rhizobium sp. AC44/96]
MFRFGKKTETRSLSNPTELEALIFGALPSAAGIVVNPSNAIAVPAVAAGIKAIAEAVGGLPMHAYTRSEDGSRERDTEHVAFTLLNGRANPWTMGGQLRELLTADAIAYGNGYAQIVRDGSDAPRELHRLFPANTAIEIDSTTGEPSYRVRTGSQTRLLASKDVLHLRAPSPLSRDSVTGRSPLVEAKDAIGLLIILQRHANQLFANGGRPSGILSFPQKLGAEVAKRIKASWQAATSGGNAGSTAVLEEGGKWEALTFNSVDNQFLEIWALSITDVARVLRVPPVLLMDYSRQTWANAETGGQQFLTYSLSPWLSRWEAEVTLKLIAPEDQKTLFVEHLTDSLLRSDFASRATAYGQYRSMGVMTANEVRAGLNLPKIDGGDVLQNPYTTTDKTAPTPDPKTDASADKKDATTDA